MLGWILLVFAVGALGSRFMPDAWYVQLHKPAWNPPNWVFAPVWSTLYLCMGLSAGLVWRRGGFKAQKAPLALFVVQLLLNGLWTPLFFGMHRIDLALAIICLLWGYVLMTIKAFLRTSPLAAWLLLPYLAWISFAGILNFAIWRLNA
jgi:tryptophan-rich sensory protein